MLSYHFTSISNVELDAKFSIRSSRVVTGGENKPTDRFEFPDDARHSRRGHDAVLTNQQTADLRQVRNRGQTSCRGFQSTNMFYHYCRYQLT